MYYWVKTNQLIKRLFCNQVWSLPNSDNKIYLTFDDGPTPEITVWVLDILKQDNIKATFFCIGKNIERNTEIFNRIISEGHSVGNHTFNHLNGWKISTQDYLKNIDECKKKINKVSKIFRPPYGKITPKQSKSLRKLGYNIIMWDILTGDFDLSISPKKCLENATRKVENGSIIVFHDSVKASKNLKYTLPKAIAHYKEKGFEFGVLS